MLVLHACDGMQKNQPFSVCASLIIYSMQEYYDSKSSAVKLYTALASPCQAFIRVCESCVMPFHQSCSALELTMMATVKAFLSHLHEGPTAPGFWFVICPFIMCIRCSSKLPKYYSINKPCPYCFHLERSLKLHPAAC